MHDQGVSQVCFRGATSLVRSSPTSNVGNVLENVSITTSRQLNSSALVWVFAFVVSFTKQLKSRSKTGKTRRAEAKRGFVPAGGAQRLFLGAHGFYLSTAIAIFETMDDHVYEW
jgi:hypothetical protein